MQSIFKRLLTFFPFVNLKSEKCFYDFYNLNEVRYGGKEDWSDRDYMLNGSFFIQYAIKFGTPGKMSQTMSDMKVHVPNPAPTKVSTDKEKGVTEKMDTTVPSAPDRDQMKKKEDGGPKKNTTEVGWTEIPTKAQKKEKQKKAKAEIAKEKAATVEIAEPSKGDRLFAKRKDLDGFKIPLTLCRNHRRYGTTAWYCNDACLFREFRNYEFMTESKQLKLCTSHSKYGMDAKTCAKGCLLGMPGALQKHIASTIKAKKCYYHTKFGSNSFKCVGWCGMKRHLKQEYQKKVDEKKPETSQMPWK